MGGPNDALLAVDHVQDVGGGTEMVDLTVGGILLHELLVGRSLRGMGEIDRFGSEQVPMTSQIGVWLLGGHDEKVFVRHAARTFKINLLFSETIRAGVIGIGVVMKVA